MPDSFEEIDHKYRKRLCAFLSKYTRSFPDAEEIAQQTLIKAYQSLDTLKDEQKLGPWLYQIAYRLVLDEARRKKPTFLNDTTDIVAPSSENPQAELQRKEEKANLWNHAQDVLTPEEFTAIWLRYAEEHPVDTIASIMSRTPGSVRVLLFRARNKLRENPMPENQ